LTAVELDGLTVVQLRSLCSKFFNSQRRLLWPRKANIVAGLHDHGVHVDDLSAEMKQRLRISAIAPLNQASPGTRESVIYDANGLAAHPLPENYLLNTAELDGLTVVQLRSLCSKFFNSQRRLLWPIKTRLVSGLHAHGVYTSDLNDDMKQRLGIHEFAGALSADMH